MVTLHSQLVLYPGFICNISFYCCWQSLLSWLTRFLVLLKDGNETFFRTKRTTALKKLMGAYCDRQSVDVESIAFLFDGRRLRGEQTPDEVNVLKYFLFKSFLSFFLQSFLLTIYPWYCIRSITNLLSFFLTGHTAYDDSKIIEPVLENLFWKK